MLKIVTVYSVFLQYQYCLSCLSTNVVKKKIYPFTPLYDLHVWFQYNYLVQSLLSFLKYMVSFSSRKILKNQTCRFFLKQSSDVLIDIKKRDHKIFSIVLKIFNKIYIFLPYRSRFLPHMHTVEFESIILITLAKAFLNGVFFGQEDIQKFACMSLSHLQNYLWVMICWLFKYKQSQQILLQFLKRICHMSIFLRC